jgi:hypothetical protein
VVELFQRGVVVVTVVREVQAAVDAWNSEPLGAIALDLADT